MMTVSGWIVFLILAVFILVLGGAIAITELDSNHKAKAFFLSAFQCYYAW